MTSPRTPRDHYIDWLRNLGILMLFPFHTARVFDYWEPNYVKDAAQLGPELVHRPRGRLVHAHGWVMKRRALPAATSTPGRSIGQLCRNWQLGPASRFILTNWGMEDG
ncbi:MAG TPA: hypothetical protein VGL40_12055 [Bacillota bacterium]|jgi:hypothetical protein